MKSIEQNIQNALAGYPGTITYTDRPKERASLDQSGIYANAFSFISGHTKENDQKVVRHTVTISLYSHKVRLIGDCNGDEDEYFKRLKTKIKLFETILLEVFSLLFSANAANIFNEQIQLAYEAAGITDQQLIDSAKITKHDCLANERPRKFVYQGPCISEFMRVGADLNGVSEAEMVDFVSISFEVWKRIDGFSCCVFDGKYAPVNNPL